MNHKHLLLVASLGLPAAAQDPAPPPAPKPPVEAAPVAKPMGIGDALPKGLVFRTIDGKQQSLDELRGKVVVFHFWSTTCPWEVVAEPKINALSAAFADKGVVVLGIAANAKELGPVPEAKAFDEKDETKRPYGALRAKAKESKINHTILVDHAAELGHLLDGKTTPHCFVFDKDGVLQYQGALDDDGQGKKENPIAYVREAVTALLAGEKPGVQTTKPYG